MNSHTSSGRSRRRGAPRRARVLAVMAGLVLLTAACSGNPSSTGSGGSSQAGGSSNSQKALAYAQCMRSNGVPDYPDPVVNANGAITFPRISSTVGTVSQPRLQAAENTCQHLLPSGSQPSQAQQQLSNELKFAQCMRSHGMPNWPDPTKMGTEYEFDLNAENISPNSPQAEAAERTCESQLQLSKSQVHLPGPPIPGGGVKVGGGS
jgi:hypothetical protein